MSQNVAIQNPQVETQKPLTPPKHNHPGTLSPQRFLILAALVLFSSVGDTFLSYGMRHLGPLSVGDLRRLIPSVFSPYVSVGVILLLCFFTCYSIALSWADLTYLLPATSLAYVLVALLGKFVLHEQISPLRWTGIFLISCGVGIVAGSPVATPKRKPSPHSSSSDNPSEEVQPS